MKRFKMGFIWALMLLTTLGVSFSSYGQANRSFPLKLKIGTYNVGHFNQGKLGGFQGGGNWTIAELHNWRNWIGEQGLDFLSVNEWNHYFDKDSTFDAQKELLHPFYAHTYFGKLNKWIYNGIATNYILSNLRQVDLDGDYYAIIGEFKIEDKSIHVISVHVPWQKQTHDGSMDKLINLLKQFEYFICMGDMNAFDASQQLFLKAGFNMANGGNAGWFPTAAGRVSSSGYGGGPNDNIDNLVTSSNIKIMQVTSPKTGLNDLDHRPIMAEVVITK